MLNSKISNEVPSFTDSSKSELSKHPQAGKKRLRKELDLYSFEISSLSMRNRKLEKTIDSLRKEIDRNRRVIDCHKSDKIRQNRKTNWLIHKVNILKKQKEQFLDDLGYFENKCSDYDNQIYELNDRIDCLAEQKDKFKKMIDSNGISQAFLKQNNSSLNESVFDVQDNTKNSLNEESQLLIDKNSDLRPYQLLLNEISGLLKCPISLQLLKNPVILPSGHTVGESYFDKLLTSYACDPFSREPLYYNKTVNRFAQSLIDIIEKIHNSFPEAKLDSLIKKEEDAEVQNLSDNLNDY